MGQGEGLRPVLKFDASLSLCCNYSQRLSEPGGLRASHLISSFCRGATEAEKQEVAGQAVSHSLSCDSVLKFLPIPHCHKGAGTLPGTLLTVSFNPHQRLRH